MPAKPKLELTWIGKEERPRLEPRILIEDPGVSHHAATRRDGDIFDNMMIQGDNLLALKALEADYAGKVKCVFIDPPYNTGSAFTHYDDGLEHSLWLTMMRDRLEILRRLLRDDGSLWITIDDNEAHYLKVLCDEMFGRGNFITSAIWEKSTSLRNDAKYFSAQHEYILIYSKNLEALNLNKSPRTEESNAAYSNPDNDPRGPWREGDYKSAKTADERPNLFYAITHPKTGAEVWPRRERVWAYGRPEHERHVREGLLWWGKTQNYKLPKLKRFRSDAPDALVPATLWSADEVEQTRTARQQMKALFGDDPFPTPKPEALLGKVIALATNPGDLVLDSFAGSGTTGAVAHKMGRRWIMVELGEHAKTHIVPRLNKVIDGADSGGVTEAVGWQGGGGYRFFRIAPSLLSEDKYGNWVISKDYNPAMLAEALCKHMGYTYAPSQNPENYWQHGQSTETDFIYVTTQQLTHDACKKIADDVGPDRSLLICCKAYSANPDAFDNLTLVKIPTAILKKCEWGRDDYSLAIQDLPEADDPAEDQERPKAAGSRAAKTLSLFDEEEGE